MYWYPEEDSRFTSPQDRVKDVLQDWAEAMKEGRAQHRYPAPEPAIPEEKVEKLIQTLMVNRILKEANRTGKAVPPFDQLPTHAKLALAQDLKRIVG